MPNYSGIYVVEIEALAVTGAITLIQIKAAATANFELLRAWLSQDNINATDQQRVRILRKTAAATVTSFTPRLYRPSDAAAKSVGGTAATGTNASAEGTDGDVLYEESFNLLNGWLWVPTPEERIQVTNAGFLAMKLPAAPAASTTFSGGMIFGEM